MSARLVKPMRDSRTSSAARYVEELVPELRRVRAKSLRLAASAIELAKRTPVPPRLLEMSEAERIGHGFALFERSGLTKREYWRESGHKCWNHAWCLVTPNKGRPFTAMDLWVLEWVLFVQGAAPMPSNLSISRSA